MELLLVLSFITFDEPNGKGFTEKGLLYSLSLSALAFLLCGMLDGCLLWIKLCKFLSFGKNLQSKKH